MSEYTAMDYAMSSCKSIRSALDAVGVVASPFSIAPHGDALVIEDPNVVFDNSSAIVVFVSADSSAPSSASIVAGIAHGIDADADDANDLVQMCNAYNQVAPMTLVAFQGDSGIDLILKIAFPPRVLVDVPQFAQAQMIDLSSRVLDVRAILDNRGISGIPHTSGDLDVQRVLVQLHTALNPD